MSKLNIKNPKNGSCSVECAPMSLVSLDYGRPQPFMMIDTVPSGDYDAQGSALVRVCPQVFPPYGRMSLKHATFFVPENMLYQGSTAFHNDQKTFQGQNVIHPWFYGIQINQLFYEGNLLSEAVVGADPAFEKYDFCALKPESEWSAASPVVYRKLTTRGRKAFAILKSLGYDFVSFSLSGAGTTYSQYRATHEFKCNAYPLLAYMRIVVDKFMNGQLYESSPVVSFLNSVYSGRNVSWVYNSSDGHLASEGQDATNIWISYFSNFGVMYESNIYNTAWNTINSPIGSNPSSSLRDSFSYSSEGGIISPVNTYNRNGEYGSIDINDSRTIHNDITESDNVASFSAYGHKMLMAVDKFIRRKGLVGTRAAQQFYAMFGIKGSDYSRNMVTLVNTGSQRLTFNAVTSTADTVSSSGGSPLGQYAGQGIGGMQVSYNYKADTYGYLISICWINIDPIKQHGFNPTTLRNNYLDYWRPQFEGQYNRPIPVAEVSGAHVQTSVNLPKNTFGFIPLYEEYKTIQDNVSGSFIDPTTERYAFMRDYTKDGRENGIVLKAQNAAVTTFYATRGNPSITNPFLYDSSVGDRLWFCVDWKFRMNLPLLPKEDTLGIEGVGDLQIEEVNGAIK